MPNDDWTTHAGHSRDTQHEYLNALASALDAASYSLYGCGVSTYAIVYLAAEDSGVAANQAREHFDTGHFQLGINSADKAEDTTAIPSDQFIETWYSEQDEEYPTWRVGVSGWGRFYGLAHDTRQLAHHVESYIDFGGFHPAVPATTWRACIDDVPVRSEPGCIIQPLEKLQEITEEAE